MFTLRVRSVWSRRIGFSFAAIALGLVAHVVGGAGTEWSCIPLLAASALGALATFGADRLAGYRSRSAGPAIALLGVGQLAMHLVLSGSMDVHADPSASAGLGLTCGLVTAHAAVTGALTVLLLGAQRSLAALAGLLTRVAKLLRVRFDGPSPVAVPRTGPVVGVPTPAAVRLVYYGSVRPRRGPPVVPVS